ncbi:MAG: glycyl-radical enzyme activating protein [Bacteroidota bacterium]
MNTSELKATIFDIQGLSVHDGPGCRTLIFLNGCTMSCFWCSNPEGMSSRPSLLYYQPNCVVCGNCANSCAYNAITVETDKIAIARTICKNCSEPVCVSQCFTDALRLSGYEITVGKLMEIIQRDRQFWGSHGGMTLTGGEPLMQIDFAEELLKRCYDSYVHTAIETCGNIAWQNFERVLSYLDWIFFDIKHFDNATHKKGTDVKNTLILDNAKKLAAGFKGKLMFRLPLVPDFNDSDSNLKATIAFLKDCGRNEINILPLHRLGGEKYKMLDKENVIADYVIPTHESLKTIKNVFAERGITCYIGSETPF